MTLNRELILTKEEIQVKRTPKELELWVEKKCIEFANNDEIEEQVLLHKVTTFRTSFTKIMVTTSFSKNAETQ